MSRPGTSVHHFHVCFFCQDAVIGLQVTGTQEIQSLFCEVMYLAEVQKFCYSQKGESVSGKINPGLCPRYEVWPSAV